MPACLRMILSRREHWQLCACPWRAQSCGLVPTFGQFLFLIEIIVVDKTELQSTGRFGPFAEFVRGDEPNRAVGCNPRFIQYYCCNFFFVNYCSTIFFFLKFFINACFYHCKTMITTEFKLLRLLKKHSIL